MIPSEVFNFIVRVTDQIINPIIGILFAGALVFFLWGLAMFVFKADEASKREEYRSHMLWGLIGLTVMISAYAILEIGLRTFGVRGDQIPDEIPLTL